MDIALIFDYDDTLVRTRECKFAALRALAQRHYGMELTDAQIETHWGKTYRTFFADLFCKEHAALDELLYRYEALSDEFPMRFHDGAHRMLERLTSRHVCGIVSAALRARILFQLEALGMPPDRFDFVHGAEETRFHKPDPRVFDTALAAISATGPAASATVIYIGDSYADYSAARDAGLRFIGIPRTRQSRDLFAAEGVPTIPALDALEAAIECHDLRRPRSATTL